MSEKCKDGKCGISDITVAKPGKVGDMMGQPPKNPNSDKMDSQIFIGKEDPQQAERKRKRKKDKKGKKKASFNLSRKTAQSQQSQTGTAIVKFEMDGATDATLIEYLVGVDNEDTIREHFLKFRPSANIVSIQLVRGDERPTGPELEYLKQEANKVNAGEYLVTNASEEDDWPDSDELDEGSFTAWCKKNGFKGPCAACVKKAYSDNKDGGSKHSDSIRGKAAFYANTVKPGGKDLGDILGKKKKATASGIISLAYWTAARVSDVCDECGRMIDIGDKCWMDKSVERLVCAACSPGSIGNVGEMTQGESENRW